MAESDLNFDNESVDQVFDQRVSLRADSCLRM